MKDINPKPDIMVFPEMTLNAMETAVEIHEPEDKVSPCNDTSYESENLVKKLSCAAIENNFYLVVNMITKAKCPDPEMTANKDPRDCKDREDGFSYYNTNVVFDRTGVIISRYRKFNLFGESVDRPYKPQLATFSTDFGVTFGHFICFDIAFRYPAAEMVRTMNLTDIIFPTMWFGELPYLTAVQVQQNWAHSLDVNLLGSGANFPPVGSGGSGIFGGKKGAYTLDMSGTNVTKVLKATVYKKIPANENVEITRNINRSSKDEMKGLKLKRDQLDVYDYSFLEVLDGFDHSNTFSKCQNGVCCNVTTKYRTVGASTTKHYQYAAVFYHGRRTFDGFADGGVITCSIIACLEKDIKTCGLRDETLQNIHIWNKIEITGQFPNKDGQYLYMPNSLDTSILPLQPDQFVYKVDHKGNQDEINMNLENNVNNLITFGIYGRDFNLDSKDGAMSITLSLSVTLFSILVLLKVF